jgi:multidrug efflux pump
MEPMKAGIDGTKEIFFAVLSTTIALAAVFLPVIFLQGLTGRLFREFGFVIAGSVIISSFVALSLTPMLSTRLLKRRETHNYFYNITEPFFLRLNAGYKSTLNAFMRYRWLVFPLMALFTATFVGLYFTLPAELAPLEDRSRMRVIATAQEGATFEYMDEYLTGVVDWAKTGVPEAEAIISVTSPGFGASSSVNSGFVNMILKNPDQREKTQQELANELSAGLRQFTGARTFVTQEPTIGNRRGGLPVQYVIQAPNMDKLKEILPVFVQEASADPTFAVVDVNLKFNKPELRVEINRERARALGVSVLDVAQTLQLAYAGQRFGYFIMDGKQYQVIGQMQRQYRNEPLDLKSLYVRNAQGDIVQLDNLVSLREESSPPQLFRYDRYVSATVSAGLAPGKTLSNGIEAMDAIADRVLDTSFRTALDGESRDFSESSSSLLFAFALALILIYLVLAAQFESFIDPLIILFTVPLAITGAFASLWFFDQTLNIFSQIGIIMLIGLVTKNGILIVEFANQRKAQGLSVMDAILDASAARFRPILMTGLSTILGILPIALALGAGSESRVSMGIAVIGGLIFAGALTLYLIPAIYSYFSRAHMVNTPITSEIDVTSDSKSILN